MELKSITFPGLDGEYGIPDPSQFAPSGTGYEKQPVVLKVVAVTDEADLTSVVEALYSTMGSSETRLVRFAGYPSTSGYQFFGFLFKSSANYGSLLVHSAFEKGTLWKKVKLGGTWQDIKQQATSIDLLWENASFESNFAQQTIALGLSGYSAVMITANGESSYFVPVGDIAKITSFNGYYICRRDVTVSTTGVWFGSVDVATTYGTNATHKTEEPSAQCRPYKIYGIKGVG